MGSLPIVRQNRGSGRRIADGIASGVAVYLLAAQFIGILRGQLVDDRFFAWAPHDQLTRFTVRAQKDGQQISAEQIALRYGLPAEDWHHRGNVQTVIRVAEGRMSPAERWDVQLRFQVNRRAPRDWCFPRACTTHE